MILLALTTDSTNSTEYWPWYLLRPHSERCYASVYSPGHPAVKYPPYPPGGQVNTYLPSRQAIAIVVRVQKSAKSELNMINIYNNNGKRSWTAAHQSFYHCLYDNNNATTNS